MEDMDRELRELTERIDFNTQRHPGPPGGRDMTFEEKRRLSIGLGNLPGDKVERVLEIIAVRHAAGLVTDSEGAVVGGRGVRTWSVIL